MGSYGGVSAYGGPTTREHRGGLDTAGVVVLGACAAWALMTAAARGGRPEGVLLGVLAVAAGYAGGRITGALLPVAAPAVGALAGVALVVLSPHSSRMPDAAAPPGDTAGTAAVLALSAGAACCAAWAAERPRARLALRLLAVATAGTALLVGSVAGCAACAVVLLASSVTPRLTRRAGLIGLAGAVAAAFGGVWAIAWGVLPRGLGGAVRGVLTEHRVALWQDALDLARDHPALGVGPGRFAEVSTAAARSPAVDGRPHSALLQQAAEQGLPGVVLLGAGFCWLLFALYRSRRTTPLVLTAGAALTALTVIAMAGNALSFTTVAVASGLVAGFATAHPLGTELLDHDGA